MKKILITGSAGFAGSHLVEHILKNTNWDIVGLDSFRHRGDSLRVIKDARYHIHTCDLSSPISHRLLSKIGDIEYIVNMAAESHVDRSIDFPVPFVQNNVNVALNALEAARILKPSVFIQISTDEVYGAAPEGFKHQEWLPALPSNPYAASKAAQEALAIAYWRTYDVPIAITNTMNLFGERQDTEKFIPMLIKNIHHGKRVPIHGNEKYIGKRHYLHARNHADAILWIINQGNIRMHSDSASIIFPDRYNVVGDVELNNLELAQMISKILVKPLMYDLIDFHAARPGHDRRYALDGSKILSKGWRAPVSFSDSLFKMVRWTLENKEWME